MKTAADTRPVEGLRGVALDSGYQVWGPVEEVAAPGPVFQVWGPVEEVATPGAVYQGEVSNPLPDDPLRVVVMGQLEAGSRTIYTSTRFFQCAVDPSTVLVDPALETPIYPLSPEHERVVQQLRESGWELMAEDVYELLLASKEPDGDPIQLFSLHAMADFLVQHRDLADPIVGSSPLGIMQFEWHIVGDGLLVIAFVKDDQLHCVVQADATEGRGAMDVSERMSSATLVERFSQLIPTRDDETR